MKENKCRTHNLIEKIIERRRRGGIETAQSVLRLLITLTFLLSIVIGMIACDAGTVSGDQLQSTQGEQVFQYIPIETTRSPEEIEATGLTVDDVLAAYDELARDAYDAWWGVSFNSDGSKVYDCIPTFESISPLSMECRDENGNTIPLPYYFKRRSYLPYFSWFREENGMFYELNKNAISNAYLVDFNVLISEPNEEEIMIFDHWVIPNNMMRKLMNVFRASEFKITEELASTLDYPYSVFEIHMEEKVYEGITITREDIQNATPEQLEVLMEALRYMYSCNFYCQLPDGDTNYNFEIEQSEVQ